MKAEAKRWLARGTFVALVAIGTLVAGPRPAVAQDCTRPWDAGSCPPLATEDGSCAQACRDIGFPDGGTCVVSCCACFE